MKAQDLNCGSQKNRQAGAARRTVATSASFAMSGRRFLAAGLVIATAGVTGTLGFRLAEGGRAVQSSGERSGAAATLKTEATDKTALGTQGHPSTSTPAGRTSGPQGTEHQTRPSLDLLRAELAAAETPEAKRAASDALIALNSEVALSAWGEALLQEKDPAARKAMMEALDSLNGEAAVEMITQLIELSGEPEVFEGVARTLSRMATADTAKYLAEIHHQATPGDARQERALRMLGSISNPASVPGLIQVAHQPVWGADVTGQAAVSLGKIGNPAAVTALAGAFDTLAPEHFAQRQQVLAAISGTTNQESRTLLSDLAAHSHQPLVAAAARDALKNLPPPSAEEPATADAASVPAASELLGKAAPGI